jgi:hypothetical protein
VSQAARDRAREAVAVFEDAETFQAAIDELLSSGFDRSDLSLLAGRHAVAKKLGHALESVVEAEDDPNVPRAAYVSTESVGDAEGALVGGLFYVGAMLAGGAMVASGGTAAGAVVAALLAGGAAGSIGTVLARWLGHHHADYLQQQLDCGGLLLWVNVRDAEHEERALEILSRHSAHDVHVHEFPRA